MCGILFLLLSLSLFLSLFFDILLVKDAKISLFSPFYTLFPHFTPSLIQAMDNAHKVINEYQDPEPDLTPNS